MTAREQVILFLDGWRAGAAFLPIPEAKGKEPIFKEGYKAGRHAKARAVMRAEKAFGYRLAILEPVNLHQQPSGAAF